MSAAPSVFVHIVTYESGSCVLKAVESVLSQRGLGSIRVQVRDNGSTHSPIAELRKRFGAAIETFENTENLGFSGAHNQGAAAFLESGVDQFLVLNPDVVLEPETLVQLSIELAADSTAGMATPLLLRCDEELNPLPQPLIDAAGMRMTAALRHFDRGSDLPLSERFLAPGYVFGGTGACLLLKRACVEDLQLRCGPEPELYEIYPALAPGAEKRAPLFDEGFFAYREDADLAWRALILGWRCRFVPQARGYHRRVVTAERRSSLPAELNRLGVRNRFLLQFNNLSGSDLPRVLVPGIIIRNLMVILGVLLTEFGSLSGLKEAWKLRRRARNRHRELIQRRRSAPGEVMQWFGAKELEQR